MRHLPYFLVVFVGSCGYSTDRPLTLEIDGLVADAAGMPVANFPQLVCILAQDHNLSDGWDETSCNSIVTDASGHFTTAFRPSSDFVKVRASYIESPPPSGCGFPAPWPETLPTTYDEARGENHATVQVTYSMTVSKCNF